MVLEEMLRLREIAKDFFVYAKYFFAEFPRISKPAFPHKIEIQEFSLRKLWSLGLRSMFVLCDRIIFQNRI